MRLEKIQDALRKKILFLLIRKMKDGEVWTFSSVV